SPRLAAAAASLPTGLPLALFIVASKAWADGSASNSSVQAQLVSFSDAVLRGVASTFAFAIAMCCAARRELGVPGMLACGYTAWFVVWIMLNHLAVHREAVVAAVEAAAKGD
ncbi:unnamed protein product, partial [Polarella glacialis]